MTPTLTPISNAGLVASTASDKDVDINSDHEHRFSRADVLRILRISSRQLAAWERAQIIPAVENYSFVDLKQAKNIRDLCAQRVRPGVIRRSLHAMQRVSGMANPLLEAAAVVSGTRLIFRHEGHTLEPETGQLLLEFDASVGKSAQACVMARPLGTARHANAQRGAQATSDEATELFTRGISLEENPETQNEAIACYEAVLELEQRHAAAHINLGTIYYNRQLFQEAELHYRCAVEADPKYALAYFDLGNVLDETGRIGDAIETYRTAVTLSPTYADAHYNLALAYEKTRQPRKALGHWRSYIQLDGVGPWAVHARTQIRKILAADGLQVVR